MPLITCKVKKKTNIWNRYNQVHVPHVTRDTIWKMTKHKKHYAQEREEVSPFPEGDHKAARNRQDSIMKTNVKNKSQKGTSNATYDTSLHKHIVSPEPSLFTQPRLDVVVKIRSNLR